MGIKLTAKQKAAIDDCSCPLPANLQRKRISKKAVIIPFAIFGVALYIVWALWPPGALWLLGIYGALVVGSIVYRLIRGHTVRCSFKWSPVVALYAMGEVLGNV